MELEPLVDQLLLADARAARALAGRQTKTDRNDSLNLALLVADDRVPTVWAPPGNIQELRNWCRYRTSQSRQHARVLHEVKSLLNRHNRPGPARMDAGGLHRSITANGHLFEPAGVKRLWSHHRRLSEIDRDVTEAEREIAALMLAPGFAALHDLLRTIPGAGLITAATVISEIGDFSRFPTSKAIAPRMLVWMWHMVKTNQPYNRRDLVAA